MLIDISQKDHPGTRDWFSPKYMSWLGRNEYTHKLLGLFEISEGGTGAG